MISQLRILDELQEEFDDDPGSDVQIVMYNSKPIATIWYVDDFYEEVEIVSAPVFTPADADDLRFGMWEYSEGIEDPEEMVVWHPLSLEVWQLVSDEASYDSVLLSKEGDILGKFSVRPDASQWNTEGVKDFILGLIDSD